MTLQRKEQGFTIVELLIVIVVIGILAAIVLTTVGGAQRKARNADRQADINSLRTQLEVYETENGTYPTLTNINDGEWRSNNGMGGLEEDALRDPNGDTSALVAAPAVGAYSYEVTPADCDASAESPCTGYTLTAVYEGEVDGATAGTDDLAGRSLLVETSLGN